MSGGTDDRPLWNLSATELHGAYKDGLQPERVMDATLERIAAVNPRLNAIVTLDTAGARAAAAESTARWRSNRPRGPLDGAPITVKDNILVAGLRATWGSRLFAGHVPEHDETPVRRLREAGAIILGKTNVPEFTVHGFTDNEIFGTTRNPWNTELTPGGSSGGAVAAVAAGLGPIAIGTDGGGSIRRPAAHTGLVGFKPSRHMVPRGVGFPAILHDFEVVGPIARCVDDIILTMNVIGGADWTASKLVLKTGPLRIAFAPSFSDAPVDEEITRAVAAAVARLQAQGHHVDRLEPFTLADPLAAIWPVIGQTGVAWLLAQHTGWQGKVGTALADMATAGDRLSAADYLTALSAIAAMAEQFDALFAVYDLLVTPATAAMPWPAQQPHPATIAGTPVGPRGHAVFTPFANALGLPAVSLPCPIDDGSLPIGLQVCAASGRDAFLLEFARDYERRLPVYRWPPI